MADKMVELVKQQPGFLSFASAREEEGITVSYWKDKESIQKWKEHLDHKKAKELGRTEFYDSYRISICKVLYDTTHSNCNKL